MCHYQTQKLLVDMYVSPERKLLLHSEKRGVSSSHQGGGGLCRHLQLDVLHTNGGLLPTSLFQGGAMSTSPALVHVEERVHLLGEVLQLSDHDVNLQIKHLGSGFRSGSDTSGMCKQISHGPDSGTGL